MKGNSFLIFQVTMASSPLSHQSNHPLPPKICNSATLNVNEQYRNSSHHPATKQELASKTRSIS